MALKFAKKAKGAGAPANDAPGASKGFSKPAATGNVSFLKKGASAKTAMANEEAAAELRKQAANKMWRFWMPDGEDRQITFLDGALDAEGMLDIYMFYEHTLRMNGGIEHFICTADVDQTQPCPICEKSDRNTLVGVMTILDHSQHTVKKGPNAGKVITNTRKLFVAKQGTIRQLTKLAGKRGGLAGCTFDVSRTGDKEPAVGNQFDFVHKYGTYEEIADKFDLKLEEVQPANYGEEFVYRTPEQLIELGVGKAVGGVGFEKGVGGLKDEL